MMVREIDLATLVATGQYAEELNVKLRCLTGENQSVAVESGLSNKHSGALSGISKAC
jgi:hypothetical protein